MKLIGSIRLQVSALTTCMALSTFAHSTDTIAFFAFKDGDVGDSALKIYNEIDTTKNVGTLSLKSSANGTGSVTFSSRRPAKYIFDGKNGSVICTDPQSIRFGRDPEMTGTDYTASGNIEIVDLGSDMSALDEYTVEFFVNVTTGEFHEAVTYFPNFSNNSSYTSRYRHSIEWEAGSWQANDPVWPEGVRAASGINLLEGNLTDGSRSYRYFYGVSTNAAGEFADSHVNYGTASLMPYQYVEGWEDGSKKLAGDQWHHVAVVHSKTDKTTRLYLDWSLSDHLTYQKKVLVESNDTLTCSAPFRIGCHRFYGSISCLRVSKKALAIEEMMHASESQRFYPETLFHWTYEGANGANAATVTNVAKTFRTLNTNLCFLTSTSYVTASRNGNGTLYTDSGSQSWYTNDVNLASRCQVYDGNRLISPTNIASLWLRPGINNYSYSWRMRPGVRCDSTTYGIDMITEHDFTVETFVKLDIDEWLKEDVTQYKRATIFGISDWAGGYTDFSLKANSVTAEKFSLVLSASKKTADNKISPTTASKQINRGDPLYDGKWHHLAVTYEHAAKKFVLYLDGVAINFVVESEFAFNGNDKHFYLGYGQNNEAICGMFDDTRMTARKLDPSEFLTMRKRPVGMTFTVK